MQFIPAMNPGSSLSSNNLDTELRRREAESERLDQSAQVRLDEPGGLASEDLIGLGLADLLSAFCRVESLCVYACVC